MYVFPVLAVKQVREDEEDHHKDQDKNPKPLALYFYRVTHVRHEVGQVPHSLVELSTGHAAFDGVLGQTSPLLMLPLSGSTDASTPMLGLTTHRPCRSTITWGMPTRSNTALFTPSGRVSSL